MHKYAERRIAKPMQLELVRMSLMANQMIVCPESSTTDIAEVQKLRGFSLMDLAMSSEFTGIGKSQLTKRTDVESMGICRLLFEQIGSFGLDDGWSLLYFRLRYTFGDSEHVNHFARAYVSLFVILQALVGLELGFAFATLEKVFVMRLDMLDQQILIAISAATLDAFVEVLVHVHQNVILHLLIRIVSRIAEGTFVESTHVDGFMLLVVILIVELAVTFFARELVLLRSRLR